MKLKNYFLVLMLLCFVTISNQWADSLNPMDIETYLNQFTWTVYFENVTEGKRIERYKAIQFRNGEIFNLFGNILLGSYRIESSAFVLDFDDFQGITLSYSDVSAAICGFKGYGFFQFFSSFLQVKSFIIRGSKIE